MGCCILGAIIFGFLMRAVRAVRGLLGLAPVAVERPNAAMWRLNAATPEQASLTWARPLRAQLAMSAVMMPFSLYIAYSLHVARLMLQFALLSGLPVSALLPYCH
ncbi:hypothetical protein GCM10010909_27340 [Acidocella aquatica]|uniref:MAPEG family protein n=1 Tax=Acidocella aquatica TaxID=1922313 RepID=A0ABQ6A9S7_9PROT|nr:hypothetical protein [Acidocella aquatica]GLR68053.1 hypothetical protein GCM10010909_27340 [Acidocella aquatica]